MKKIKIIYLMNKFTNTVTLIMMQYVYIFSHMNNYLYKRLYEKIRSLGFTGQSLQSVKNH